MAHIDIGAHNRGSYLFMHIRIYRNIYCPFKRRFAISIFFLLYFLIFSLSILLDPIVSLLHPLVIMFLFAWHVSTYFSVESLMPTYFSTFSCSVLPSFLGKEHQELQEAERIKEESQSNTFLFYQS